MSDQAPAAVIPVELLSVAERRERLVGLVLDTAPSPDSKRAYHTGLEQFFAWWEETAPGESFARALVQRYRAQLEAEALAAASINLRLALLRKLAEEAAAHELLPLALASGVRSVRGVKQRGTRAGNWLTRQQAQRLLALPDLTTDKGKRDRALLALLLAAGLRRDELARLTIEHVQQRDNRWCLVDLLGKGKRIRTVALPDWVKTAIDEWLAVAPFRTGPLLGRINKGGKARRAGHGGRFHL